MEEEGRGGGGEEGGGHWEEDAGGCARKVLGEEEGFARLLRSAGRWGRFLLSAFLSQEEDGNGWVPPRFNGPCSFLWAPSVN